MYCIIFRSSGSRCLELTQRQGCRNPRNANRGDAKNPHIIILQCIFSLVAYIYLISTERSTSYSTFSDSRCDYNQDMSILHKVYIRCSFQLLYAAAEGKQRSSLETHWHHAPPQQPDARACVTLDQETLSLQYVRTTPGMSERSLQCCDIDVAHKRNDDDLELRTIRVSLHDGLS